MTVSCAGEGEVTLMFLVSFQGVVVAGALGVILSLRVSCAFCGDIPSPAIGIMGTHLWHRRDRVSDSVEAKWYRWSRRPASRVRVPPDEIGRNPVNAL
jgi:hypothetical protein